MMHAILTLLIAFVSLFHSPTTNYARMVEKTQASIVRIEVRLDEGLGECSGFVVETHLVLTANHCTGGDMTGDGIGMRVVKQDAENDLALVYSATLKLPLSLRDTPVAHFEDLTSIGYGYGLHSITALQNKVIMVDGSIESDNIPNGIIVSPGYIGGMSGGPVVDSRGLVVGIVQRGSAQIGYGVNAATILAFLGT